MKVIHSLRVVAAGAMVGTVAAGIAFGWSDHGMDLRVIGAVLGAATALAANVAHRA